MFLQGQTPVVQQRESDMVESMPGNPRSFAIARLGIGSQTMGALAAGAIAFGSLAVGALAIGALAISRARVRRLEIDELIVHKLRVTERLQVPAADNSR